MPHAEALVRQLDNLPPGAHACPIYSRLDDKRRLLVPYFQAGIAQGEQCLYIADAASIADLRAHGIGSDEDLARSVLIPLTARESYLRHGRFDPDKLVELWTERLAAAHAAGYVGLRVAAEMTWVFGPDLDAAPVIEYEARLNRLLHATSMRAMCLYDWRQSRPSMLHAVFRTHPLAIIDLRLHDNPYYEPPALVLGNDDGERARLNWMVAQLQSLTRRVTALVDLGHLALDSAPAELIRAAELLVTTELGFQFVQIHEVLPSGDAVRLVGTTGPDSAAIGSLQPLTPDHPLTSTALGLGLGLGLDGPLIISDWQHETRFTLPGVLREAGVTSSISMPISVRAGEPLYGVLTAHSQHARIFSDDECLLLESVAIFLAHALAAARSAASFRALVDNAPDVIVRFDGDLRVAYVNPSIERATGTAAESLVGQTSLELGVHEAHLAAWELTLRRAWRTGREQEFELLVRSALGERVFDCRIVPEIGAHREVQSLLSIARDITTQRAAEAERSELYRQLVVQQNHVQELLGRISQDRERSRRGSAAASLFRLTDREQDILRLLAAGHTNREIGAAVGLTAGTTKNKVAQILGKLGVTDRTQAAVRAVELGIVAPATE